MAYNPLDERPEIRKVLYIAQWICNGLVGAASIIFLAQSDDPPKWFTIVVAVLAFLWTYTGITAQGNTPAGGVPGNPDPPPAPEGPVVGKHTDTDWKNEAGQTGNPLGLLIWLLVVVVVIVIVVWLLRVLLAGA